MATKVKLLKKPISGNRHSLYLDYYPPIEHPKTGKPTRREFLGLYLIDKPKNNQEKEQNKTFLAQGEAIAALRRNELMKEDIYSPLEKEYRKKQKAEKQRAESSFLGYFEGLVRSRKGSNHDNWVSTLAHLKRYSKDNLTFADVTQRFCADFRHYLLSAPNNRGSNTPLARNSAHSYFNKFKAALKQAYKEKLLPEDLNAEIEGIKPAETHRNFLTIEELNALATTECKLPTLKRAAMFSAMTGLRFGDIQQLTWDNIQMVEEDKYYLQFTQAKTQGVETLPISKQAVDFLGVRGEFGEKVFKGLKYSANNNYHLERWIRDAGITKKITFHCFRHTNAMLLLEGGTDLYTVSKMLGHRDIKTTQIYAKVGDMAKRKASEVINIESLNFAER